MIDLDQIFRELNDQHFDGMLDWPALTTNDRLRSSAGRFIPGSRSMFYERPPKIEIAYYLFEEDNAEALVRDTMGHEMIHYWLWIRRRPYGHTPEFWAKMRDMGVSRYNTVPRARPYLYVYRCLGCAAEYPARKRLGVLACAKCCKTHNHGRYDARFKLVQDRKLSRAEGLELVRQKLAAASTSAERV